MYSVISVVWVILRALPVLGIIIFVHELGHFLAAKRLGIKVEKFSIGFGPKLIGFKRGDTEYRISWLLIIGGYVKMAGEHPAEEPKEEEGQFLSAPVSHRATVAVAGPGMNMILAVFAVALAYMIGMPSHLVPRLDTTIGYVEPDSPASEAGIVPGDEILSVDGYKVGAWGDIQENVAINPDEEIEIILLRNESEEIGLRVIPERVEGLAFSVDSDFQGELDNSTISEDLRQEFENNRVSLSPDAIVLIEETSNTWLITDKDKQYPVRKEMDGLNVYRETDFGMIGVSPTVKPIVGSVEGGSVAAEAGFRPDDIIETINHNKVGHIMEFFNELQNVSGESVVSTVRRDENIIEMTLPLEFDEDGQLISLGGLSFGRIVRLNPVSAFRVAVPETVRMGGKIFQLLKRMIIRDVPMKYIAGPIGIVQLTMAVMKTGLGGTLHFAGMLSVNLGIINLLPLFITDGGMIFFLIVEKLRGKRMSYKKQLIIQQVGVGFIILLFLFITYNDILRLISSPF